MAAGVLFLAACASHTGLMSKSAGFCQAQGAVTLALEAVQDSYLPKELVLVRVVIKNTNRGWVYLPTFEDGPSFKVPIFYEWFATTQDGKRLTRDQPYHLLPEPDSLSSQYAQRIYRPTTTTFKVAPCETIRVETRAAFPFMSTYGQPRWQGPVLVHLVYHPEKAERVENTDLYPEKLEAEVVLTFGAEK